MIVSEIFREAGINDAIVQMGKVSTSVKISDDKLKAIEKQLNLVGFEIINNSRSRLIEKIKKLTIDYVYHHAGMEKENFSTFLISQMNLDYNYLSSLYSWVEGTTIEKHLINLKIERVKELLVYDEKTLSEIAWEMGYSSVAHLSGQFKKVTGFTPSYFRQLKEQKRKSIDKV
jgi:AraC-like DNA-binding protein